MPTFTPLTHAFANGTATMSDIFNILLLGEPLDGSVVEAEFGKLVMSVSGGVVSSMVVKFDNTNSVMLSGLSLNFAGLKTVVETAHEGNRDPFFEFFRGIDFNGNFSNVDGPVTALGVGGDDSFRLTNAKDQYVLDGGDDDVEFLGGDDLATMSGFEFVASGLSLINGGEGFDTFMAEGVNVLTGQFIDMRHTFTIETSVGSFDVRLTDFECIMGSAFNDGIIGTSGKDTLIGRDGNDKLTGGRGADTLQGTIGKDDFIYLSIRDSRPGERDTIMDFGSGRDDDIDLSAIDPATRNDKFLFIGENAFSGRAGELRFQQVDKKDFENDYTFVRADTDGDGKVDLEIRLRGLIDLEKGDFIL